jgi:hypothetical protein
LAHTSIERMLDYWRERREDRRLPRRIDIGPAGFPNLASRAFIAALGKGGALTFRLAGEEIIELWRRPLTGVALTELWCADHRSRILRLAALSIRAAEPLVLTAVADDEDAPLVRLEMLLAPLTGPSGAANRFLGLEQLLGGARPARLGPLSLVDASTGQASRPALRLAAVDGRRIA